MNVFGIKPPVKSTFNTSSPDIDLLFFVLLLGVDMLRRFSCRSQAAAHDATRANLSMRFPLPHPFL